MVAFNKAVKLFNHASASLQQKMHRGCTVLQSCRSITTAAYSHLIVRPFRWFYFPLSPQQRTPFKSM